MIKKLSLLVLVVAVGFALPACLGGDDEGGGDVVAGEDGGNVPEVSGSISLAHAGTELAPGSAYNIPDNNDPASSNIPLFSEQKDLMTVTNSSDGDVTLNSITIESKDGTLAEEFSIADADSLTNEGLTVVDEVVAAGTTFDFYARFNPVFSGERRAALKISYTDSEGSFDYVVNITGSGRPSDNAHPFSGGELTAHKVLGHIDTDEQVTGMVGDKDGNTYYLAQTKVVPGYDGFYYDMLIGRVNADGTEGWSKIYSRENAWEYCPDPGQNDETGGSPNAIVLAGDTIYIAGTMSETNSNNNTAVHVMKINASDGALVWDKVWRPEWTEGSFLDRMSAVGYAVAVAGGRVFVTGTTGDGAVNGTLGSNSSILLLGLSDADGSLAFQYAADVAPTYNDRGYAVVADAAGANVYVGGLTNGRGLLMKFTATDTAAPQVAWTQKVDMGTGSNVYGLDLDGEDIYLALDRRGASTFFSVAKVAGADGSVVWAKTYSGNNGDKNNCNVVKVFGEHVYAGGRIGFSVMDAQMGDGFVLRLGKADGALDFAGVYYTGKGPNDIEEHRVKGIAVAGDQLYLAGQVYTGSTGDGSYRYDGYWYDGLGELSDYAEFTTAPVAAVDLYETTAGSVRNTADESPAAYDDRPAVLGFGDAVDKKNGNGGTVDEDLFWMKLSI